MILRIVKKIESLFKDSFSKGFFTLLSGSLLGQVINLLMSPIITRIFSPQEFGYFGVFTSLVSILTGVTTLKLEMALPLKQEKNEYSELFWTCLVVNLVISIFCGLLFGLLPYTMYEKLNITPIYHYWWLLAIALFFTGTNRIFNSAVVRFKAFKEISISFLNQIIIKNLFQAGVGVFYPTGVVLIIGTILNQITSLFNLFRVVNRKKIVERPKLNKEKILTVLKQHKDYVIFGTPSGLANTLGLYLPVPLVMFFYGSSAAGSLSFGITLISIPMRVIGMSISQVFIGEASEMLRKEIRGVGQLYNKILKKLSQFIIGPSVLILVLGKWMFPIIFGKHWVEAGEFIQLLTICFALQFISSPLSQILNLLILQRVQLIWDLLRLLLTCITLIIPPLLGLSVKVAIIWFSIGMSISYLVLIWLCRYYVNLREDNLIKKSI